MGNRLWLRMTLFLTTLTLLLGGSVLVGWITNSLQLIQITANSIPMAPTTALCFVVLSATLLYQHTHALPLPTAWHVWVGGVFLFALILLAQFALNTFAHLTLDIEQGWSPASLSPQGELIGRMSPLTAMLFSLLALAVWRMGFAPQWPSPRYPLTQSLATVIGIIVGILLLGYWYEAPLFYNGPIIPVALPSAVAFGMLSGGILFERDEAWLRHWLISHSVFSQFTRWVLPGILVILVISGRVNLTLLKILSPTDNALAFSVNLLLVMGLIGLITLMAARRVQTAITDAEAERQRAEAALRVSEERFRGYFEQSLVGFAITSPDKGWLAVNQATCDLLGYTAEELSHTTWAELTHPADLSADTAHFERMLAGEMNGYRLEKRFIHKNGHIVFTDLNVRYQRPHNGDVGYMMALLLDITERQQAEENLRDRNAELLTLNAIANYLGQGLDLDRMAQTTLHKTVEGLGAEGGLVFLLEERSANLQVRLIAHQLLPPAYADMLRGLTLEPNWLAGLTAPAATDKIIGLARDLAASDHPDLADPFPALMTTPILAHQKMVGLLGIFRRTPPIPYFSKHALLVTIGSQLVHLGLNKSAVRRPAPCLDKSI